MSLKGGLASVQDCFVVFSFVFRWYQSLCIGVCSWPKSFLVRRPFAFVALFRLFCVFVTCWNKFSLRFLFSSPGSVLFSSPPETFVSLKNFIPSFLVQVQLCSHWIKLVAASPSLWTKDKLQSFRIIQKDLWLFCFLKNLQKNVWKNTCWWWAQLRLQAFVQEEPGCLGSQIEIGTPRICKGR